MQETKVHILVADDDEHILKALEKLLERAGYTITKASNGNEAVRLYRQVPPDLVITDLLMPEKDGLEVIVEIKRDFPDARIIAISGGGNLKAEEHLEAAIEIGALRAIRKPFSSIDLLGAVQEVLGYPSLL